MADLPPSLHLPLKLQIKSLAVMLQSATNTSVGLLSPNGRGQKRPGCDLDSDSGEMSNYDLVWQTASTSAR